MSAWSNWRYVPPSPLPPRLLHGEREVEALEAMVEGARAQSPSGPRVHRCGLCRQPGHNRTNCPHSGADAIRLTVEFNQARRAEHRAELMARDALRARAQAAAETRALEEIRGWDWHPQGSGPRERAFVGVIGPSKCKIAMQNILFENAEKIPDGVYKELMDALLIKD